MVLCVASAAAIGLFRIDEVLGLFDWRSDQNAALAYLERIHGDDGVVANRQVVEDARALMPEDAAYRVLVGPHLRAANDSAGALISDYLRYLLVPRRQIETGPAEWVFCYGCELSELSEQFEVLSDGGDGTLFGRT
ncbi:MAG: hypothetical protein WEB90_06050 [Gemmatimonadota bacterium]